MSLEEAFYIIGIATMSLSLVLMITLVITVLVIKSKINRIHRVVEDKLQPIGAVAQAAKSLFGRFTS